MLALPTLVELGAPQLASGKSHLAHHPSSKEKRGYPVVVAELTWSWTDHSKRPKTSVYFFSSLLMSRLLISASLSFSVCRCLSTCTAPRPCIQPLCFPTAFETRARTPSARPRRQSVPPHSRFIYRQVLPSRYDRGVRTSNWSTSLAVLSTVITHIQLAPKGMSACPLIRLSSRRLAGHFFSLSLLHINAAISLILVTTGRLHLSSFRTALTILHGRRLPLLRFSRISYMETHLALKGATIALKASDSLLRRPLLSSAHCLFLPLTMAGL